MPSPKFLLFLYLLTAFAAVYAIYIRMNSFKDVRVMQMATITDTTKVDTTKNEAQAMWYHGDGFPKLKVKADTAYYLDRVSGDLFQKIKPGKWDFIANLYTSSVPQ